MDRIVRPMGCCNEKVWLKDCFVPGHDIIDRHWIHVMNDWAVMDLVSGNSKIATVISSDNMIANALPLSRPVKCLVKVSVKAECVGANGSVKTKILVSLFKVGNPL